MTYIFNINFSVKTRETFVEKKRKDKKSKKKKKNSKTNALSYQLGLLLKTSLSSTFSVQMSVFYVYFLFFNFS